MDLSIVIISFNTVKLTSDCLASVVKSFRGSDISYEIIVVDNDSTDGSREMIKNRYPKVILIQNKENVGF